MGAEATWIMPAVLKRIAAFRRSMVEEPPIRLGTQDPYVPPTKATK